MNPTLLDYQESAVAFLIKRKRALVQSPAGSGKTIMAAAALHRVLNARPRNGKVLVGWIANTNEQCDQARAALAMFDGLGAKLIATVACPAGIPPGFTCDVLIVDEAHHLPAKSWLAIASTHAGCLWMFTATPFGEDEERNSILRQLAANEIHVVPRSAVASRVVSGEVRMLSATDDPKIMQATIDEAISKELGRMVPRVLYMRKFDYWRRIADNFCAQHSIARGSSLEQLWAALNRGAHREALQKALFTACSKDMWPRVAFRMCLDIGIAENERRNSAIVRLASEHRRDAVLILVNTVIHGTVLAERLEGSVVCHSKMGAKRRRLAMEQFRDGRLWCMIATSLADEGLDVPRANVLILAGAGRSSAKTEQRTGRVLRAFGDKERGRIYDFTDPQHPLLASQSRKRQALYRELGYSVEAHNPDQQALFR